MGRDQRVHGADETAFHPCFGIRARARVGRGGVHRIPFVSGRDLHAGQRRHEALGARELVADAGDVDQHRRAALRRAAEQGAAEAAERVEQRARRGGRVVDRARYGDRVAGLEIGPALEHDGDLQARRDGGRRVVVGLVGLRDAAGLHQHQSAAVVQRHGGGALQRNGAAGADVQLAVADQQHAASGHAVVAGHARRQRAQRVDAAGAGPRGQRRDRRWRRIVRQRVLDARDAELVGHGPGRGDRIGAAGGLLVELARQGVVHALARLDDGLVAAAAHAPAQARDHQPRDQRSRRGRRVEGVVQARQVGELAEAGAGVAPVEVQARP